jgi:hypothetical protein
VPDQPAGLDQGGRGRDLGVRDAQEDGGETGTVGAAAQRAGHIDPGRPQPARQSMAEPAGADHGKGGNVG